MDIKQLVTGNPKTGFYPVTQDTITVIELNKSVMNLTNGSSSEEIIAAFDNLESFQALIAEVRNPQNICSGILVNETPEDKRVGKYEATIIANTDAETLHVRWVENDKIVALTITNTDGTMSCIRNENNVGGSSVDLSNYLAKNNTTEFIPTEDYNPATKKYVDEKEYLIFEDISDLNNNKDKVRNKVINEQLKGIIIKSLSGESSYSYSLFNIENIIANGMMITFSRIKYESTGFITFLTLESAYSNDYKLSIYKYAIKTNGLFINDNNKIDGNFIDPIELLSQGTANISNNGYAANNTSCIINRVYDGEGNNTIIGWDIINGKRINLKFNAGTQIGSKEEFVMPVYNVVTESEYAALGTSVNTDNVLYFVTPDA